MLREHKDQWKVNTGLSHLPRRRPPASSVGETWSLMEVRGSGYNVAGRAQ
jgi:hypothetical protein